MGFFPRIGGGRRSSAPAAVPIGSEADKLDPGKLDSSKLDSGKRKQARKKAKQVQQVPAWLVDDSQSGEPSFKQKKKKSRLPEGLTRVFEGKDAGELGVFVTKASLSEEEVALLLSEVQKGETVVAEDANGDILRVVSVAKPILLDVVHGELLVELWQSKLGCRESLKLKATGVSEKFSPLIETSKDACARALAEELGWAEANAAMFSTQSLKVVETAPSAKFSGLRSEYHLYMHMLKPEFVAALQNTPVIPRHQLTCVDEHCQLQPKSLWWAWIRPHDEDVVNDQIAHLAKQAGLPFGDDQLAKHTKFGTPAQTILQQMDKASAFLAYLMT